MFEGENAHGAEVFNAGLDEAEIRDDAALVAQALTAYCPKSYTTAPIFQALARIVKKAQRSVHNVRGESE
jgi:hypothetical protein